jgi:hypothetical protein
VRAWLGSIGLDSECLGPVTGCRLLELTSTELESLGLPQPEADRLLQNIQWLRHGNGRGAGSPEAPLLSVPEEFLCPITCDIMRQPVRCGDGFVYEEAAIKGGESNFSLFFYFKTEG